MNSTFISFVSGLTDYLLYASIITAVLITIDWSIIRLGKIKAPVYKHMIWLCTLFIIVVLPVVWLYTPKVAVPVFPANMALSQKIDTHASSGINENRHTDIQPLGASGNTLPVGFYEKLLTLISVKNILAGLWFIGFLFMLVRFLIGWKKIKGIVHEAEPLPGDFIPGFTFPSRLKLLQSGQIDGPLCLGVFRPVILLPKEMCSIGISGDLMMILSHELAHVERRDWLVSILQNIIEAILFFHPMIWYANAQLTNQREILCDHHVISKGVPPTDYIEMLTRVLEQGFGRNSRNAVALFEGRRLLSRTRTLLKAENKFKLKPSPMAIIVSVMIFSLLIGFSTIRLEAKSPGNKQKVENILSDKDDELFEAIEKGNLSDVSAALNNGADVNVIGTRRNITPLIKASAKGHEDIVRLLIDNGADVSVGNNFGYTALVAATWPGHTNVVRLLLNKGVDLNAKDVGGGTVLMGAAGSGHIDVVKLLLDNYADVNAKDIQGRTALMYTSGDYKENLGIVRLLLANSADVHAKDAEGGTALIWASLNGRSGIVQLLVNAGAKEDNNSKLILATRKGDLAGVSIALSNGANINAKYTDGTTALMVASEMSHGDIVQCLMDNGADINLKDTKGRTAQILAGERGRTAIVQLLKGAGGIVHAQGNALAKSTLRNAAIAQEAYWVDNKTYAVSIDSLTGSQYGLNIDKNVTFQVISVGKDYYQMSAINKQGDKKYTIDGPGKRIEE